MIVESRCGNFSNQCRALSLGVLCTVLQEFGDGSTQRYTKIIPLPPLYPVLRFLSSPNRQITSKIFIYVHASIYKKCVESASIQRIIVRGPPHTHKKKKLIRIFPRKGNSNKFHITLSWLSWAWPNSEYALPATLPHTNWQEGEPLLARGALAVLF